MADSRELLSVDAALAVVRQHARPLPARPVPLLDALGRTLAQDVVADADSPPFTKSMMDGYAVRAGDSGPRQVIEEILAGMVPARTVEAGQASRIMTGAMVPPGADAVVPVERTKQEGDRVQITAGRVNVNDNILAQGTEMRAGEVILRAARVLRPQDLGILATVGCGKPLVTARPLVHILTTGDEVVGWDQTPGPGQIRNSNGPMLRAQVERAGGTARYVGIIPDDEVKLRTNVALGMLGDVLILSGGVSAGKRDLVPEVLTAVGVTAHFHKVALKPGKPLLFGTKAREGEPPVLVFGLPGNPVSSFVCFELFVRPALAILAGREGGPHVRRMPLAEPVLYRTDRPTYHPAALESGRVRLVPWFGSADLRGLAAADALAVIPAGDNNLAVGDSLDVLSLEET
jgi:molybdopterin molybdotransferase